MERIDFSSPQLRQAVKAGSLILLQGENNKAFNILHSGLAEVLYNENFQKSASAEDLLKDSLRVGLLKGEALIDVVGLLQNDEPTGFSVRAVSDCLITTRPMKAEDFIVKMQEDLPLNLKVLRDLVTRVESAFYIFNNYKYLWHKYASIADSFALGCGIPETRLKGEAVQERSSSSLAEYSSYLKGLIRKGNLKEPEQWDHNLFLGRLQDQLNLYHDHDNLIVDNLIDNRQYHFIKRLVQKDDQVLESLFHEDEPTNRYVFNFLGETIELLLDHNKKLAYEIDHLIACLYSDTGWIASIMGEKGKDHVQFRKFLHFLTKFSWRCRKDTLLLLGKDILIEYKVFSWLKQFREVAVPQEREERKSSLSNEVRAKKLAKYNGLLERILTFSGVSQKFREDFTALVDLLAASENKFDSTKEMQLLRSQLTEQYWELYEMCFLKIIDSDLKGFLPGIMLHCGVLDERFLSEDELLMIDEFYAGPLFIDESVPVMTLPYFLEKIYKAEVSPSITEMGDSFASILEAQKKMTKKEREKASLFENTPEDRVRFELRKVSRELGKVLFGNKKKSLPFLCSEILAGNMKRFFIEPEFMMNRVEKYKKRDFSLFYREVLFKHAVSSEFIQKEVIPNFVFYPMAGARSVLWQEMDGTKKNTAGRLFYPLIFTGKLEEDLLTQLAYFRWEVQKTIAGYNWTDPVEGGLVGIYYDYIRFYKRNPNITPEAKIRLEEFIKKTKSDKDRFARDYVTWVQYEYEGKLRLNSYVRDIFYRYCPFPVKIRTGMAQKPAFTSLENKYKNRKQKDLLKLQSKINKFQKKNIPLPGELVEYKSFLEW